LPINNAQTIELSDDDQAKAEFIKTLDDRLLYSEDVMLNKYDKDINKISGYEEVISYSYKGNEVDGSMAIFEKDNQYSFIRNLGNNQYQVFGKPIYYKNDNGQVQEIITETTSPEVWFMTGEKTTAEKIISLLKTPYVYADSYNASSDDSIRSVNVDWATAHNATTGIIRNTTSYFIGSYLWESSQYFCERAFLNFDTSAFGDSDTIGTSSLFIYVEGKQSSVQNTYTVYDSTAGDTIVADDYNNFGSDAFSNSLNHNDITTNSWQEFVLNDDGKANINKTGISKFSIREGNYDVANSAPVGVELRLINVTDNSQTNKPYLIVNVYQEEEEPTATTTSMTYSCGDMMFNQKCTITGYEYASGTLATTTEITTYQFLNLFYMIFEFFVCALVILGLIKYKF